MTQSCRYLRCGLNYVVNFETLRRVRVHPRSPGKVSEKEAWNIFQLGG